MCWKWNGNQSPNSMMFLPRTVITEFPLLPGRVTTAKIFPFRLRHFLHGGQETIECTGWSTTRQEEPSIIGVCAQRVMSHVDLRRRSISVTNLQESLHGRLARLTLVCAYTAVHQKKQRHGAPRCSVHPLELGETTCSLQNVCPRRPVISIGPLRRELGDVLVVGRGGGWAFDFDATRFSPHGTKRCAAVVVLVERRADRVSTTYR